MATTRRARWPALAVGLTVGASIGFLGKDLNLLPVISYWDNQAPFVLGAALVGAVLWRTRARWLLGLAAASLLLLWTVVAFTPLCSWLAADLIREDTLRSADAVFVLGSYVQMDGDLSDEAVSRLLHGLELLQQDYAPRLVLSELPPPHPSHSKSVRQLMEALAVQHDVVSVGETANTHSEAVAVAALYRERGWERLLVVTAPYHSRRACASLEHEGVAVVCSPSVERSFDVESLAEPDERLRSFSAIMHERLGLWVYAQRGWLSE